MSNAATYPARRFAADAVEPSPATKTRWLWRIALVTIVALCALSAQAQSPALIDSITVKWRADIVADATTPLPPDQYAALANALQNDPVLIGRTSDGAFEFSLPQAQDVDTARRAINRVRMTLPVLYASLGIEADSIAATRAAPLAITRQPPINRLIVKYRDATLSRLSARNGVLGAAEIDRLSAQAGQPVAHERAMSNGAFVVRLFRGLDVDQARALADYLQTDPSVAYAELDRRKYPTLVPNDPLYAQQWHYMSPPAEPAGVNLPPAWDITIGSSSIVIAVIDTGSSPLHPDLAGRYLNGYDMVSEDVLPNGMVAALTANDGDGRDSDPSDPGDWITKPENNGSIDQGFFAGCGKSDSSWHGTHVAGTIAAASNNGVGVAGINWVSQILPVRVLGKCGGYDADIADAITWATGGSVPGVPDNPNPARVLNLSLGGPGACGATFQTAIDGALAAGAVVAIAAGNDNADAANSSPGNCNGVITVAAIGRTAQRASYSNFGTLVEIAAPGGDGSNGVLSTLNSGTTSPNASGYDYEFYEGTSMATPHVAGIASLVLSVKPSLTPAQVLAVIQSTARAFPSGSNPCTTATCGAGIIDAGAAVASLVPPPVPTGVNASDGVSGTSVAVTWMASSGAVSYAVYRSTAAGAQGSLLGTPGATSFTDGTATPGTIYYYGVTATGAGGTSVLSAQDSGYAAPPPAAPTGLNASDGTSTTSVALTWNASNGATSYTVYRSTTSGVQGSSLGAPATTSFTDSGATPGTIYYYGVTATGVGGNSALSAQDSGYAALPPPSPPTAVSASDGTSTTTVAITWNVSAGATSYAIYRSTAQGSQGLQIGTATVPNFSDGTAIQGTLYYYGVTGVGPGGTSALSVQDSGYVALAPPPASTTALVSSLNPSTVGASVTFTATVAGIGPTGSVNFISDGTTIGGCGSVALSGSGNSRTATCITSTLTAATHVIVAAYGGDLGNAPSSNTPLSQVVTAAPASINVALTSNGGIASASSTYSAAYPIAAINNNERAGLNWGNGGGWNDNTINVFPDWVQINFSGSETIDHVVVYTLQDNLSSPAKPTDTMTFSLYGITAFNVQTWNGSAWVTQGTVSGNNLVKRTINFAAVTTDRIRINISNALASFSRITEVEAWGVAAAGPPPSTTTLASSLNPSTVGTSVTFTATVAGSIPTGSLSFTSDGATISGCSAVALTGSGNSRSALCATGALTLATHTIVAMYSGDANNAASVSTPLSQVVSASGSINVALAANGAKATASSTFSNAYPVSAIINNERAGLNWGNGGGWNDATGDQFPDTVQITFGASATISRVVVYTAQDNYTSPVEPTDTMTFSLYGITAFTVQGKQGSKWVTLATVTGNNLVKRTVTFAPFTTNQIRVAVTSALASYSRVTEVEAWSN